MVWEMENGMVEGWDIGWRSLRYEKISESHLL